MQRKTRQLAAVMFTDMVGYTALMQEDEQQAISNRNRHREVLESSVAKHNGIILQYYGDGTLCIFNSAIDAVNCSIEIQLELHKKPKIPLRIGLHAGDIVYSDDGVYGDAVNIASRIETLATPGCVLISGKVFDEIKNQPSISAILLGDFDLKNVKKPVSVFALENEGLTVPRTDKLNLTPRDLTKSIAVLPFVNMSTDKENEYFSDGITEEILNALTRVEGLQVTSRTSSFAFKGQNIDIRMVGSQLKVSSVLEGSVRKAGNRVRITAQLINSADGYHLWSENYDRDLEDIFAVQDDIAKRISNTLREKLNIDQIDEPLVKKPTTNIDAHNFYLKGRYYFNRWNPRDAMKAIGFLEEAIKIEPDFALAHTLMAGCYTLIGAMGQKDTDNLFAKAKTIAQKSLKLDENIGETHIALGSVQYWYEWDIEGARDSCIKALQLSDNLVDSYQLLAMVEMSLKRFDSAVEAINKALRLDPLSLPIHISASFIYLCREEYDEALVYSQRALEYEPNFIAALETEGWVYALQNEFEKALESFNQLHQLSPNPHRAYSTLGYSYACMGNREKAEFYLQELINLQSNDDQAKYYFDLAIVYAALSDEEKMFYYLEKAVDTRVGAIFINIHPGWKSYRSDPRFVALVKKAGLPE